jgi:steroid delta-isomerase
MPTPDEIRAAIQEYIKCMCASDIDGIIALYTEDAFVEDPVGADPKEGREALREFYGGSAPKLQVELTGPICIAGLHCAVPMLAELTLSPEAKFHVDVIDVMQFNAEGKIRSMQAYWDPAAMRPAS